MPRRRSSFKPPEEPCPSEFIWYLFEPEDPPEEFTTWSVLLADGSTDHATWTGREWWRMGAMDVVFYRPQPDMSRHF